MTDAIIESALQAVADAANKAMMEILTTILQWIVTATEGFWTHGTIMSVMNLAQWGGRVVFLVSLIVVIMDMAEDYTSGKQVYVSTVAANIAKGIAFVEIAPTLARYSLELTDRMVLNLNLASHIETLELGLAETLLNPGSGVLLIIILLIAVIAFLVMVLKRFGMMLVQIITYCLYVPGVVRGDTTDLQTWMRQTIGIAATFFCQYLVFYLGLFFWVGQDTLIAIGLWLSLGMISRMMDKFGLSTGVSGGFSAVASAAQGVMVMAR